MKNIGIAKPCSENWNRMDKNATGAFCQSCKKNVIDFTSMDNAAINRVLFEARGSEICGRILPEQVRSLDEEFRSWQVRDSQSFRRAFLFSLIVVFGFSLFSCSDDVQKKEIQQIRRAVKELVKDTVAEVIPEVAQVPAIEMPVPQPEILTIVYPPVIQNPAAEEKFNWEDSRITYQGGMGFSNEYRSYIEQVITETPADEYDENGELIPKAFSALAFPNPTRDVTTIEIKLPAADDFILLLLDMTGKTLSELHSGNISRGTFRTSTDLSEYPAGTYFIAISSKSFREVVKVMKI